MSIPSVVNYAAWNEGYMPPSEHVLIDQLSYRGAKVVCMSDWGKRGAWWLVTRGPKPSGKQALAIFRQLELMGEDHPAPEAVDVYAWRDPFA